MTSGGLTSVGPRHNVVHCCIYPLSLLMLGPKGQPLHALALSLLSPARLEAL